MARAALLDGRMQLADTGSPTTELSAVRRAVADARLDAREAEIPRWWPESAREPLGAYFRTIREQVNERELGRAWGTGATPSG